MKYTITCKLQCNSERDGEELFAAGVELLEENGYKTEELYLRPFFDMLTIDEYKCFRQWRQWYEDRLMKEQGENETQQSTCTGEEI